MRGYPYVMTGEDRPGEIKVGYSGDPARRRKQIYRNGTMTVVYIGNASSHPDRVEKAAHHFLIADGKAHKGGDWFAATAEDGRAAIERAELALAGFAPLPPKPPHNPLLHVRLKAGDILTLDDCRRHEVDLPNRAEMVRRLILRAGEARP